HHLGNLAWRKREGGSLAEPESLLLGPTR
ncbi:MAG: hypothetical protein JWQ73_3967, partial [Variovorax sp.]|nr:hypothetical protein [Variovorax sp.]